MKQRWLGPDDLPALLPLVETYAYDPYRDYRVFRRSVRTAILQAEIEATLRHPDGLVCLGDSARGGVAVVARRLAWDTAFFRVPMARIEYVLGDDPDGMRDAIREVLKELASQGVRHVSARVDVGNIGLANILQGADFRLRETLVSYVSRPRKEPALPVRSLGTVRHFRTDDGPELVRIAEDTFRSFRGRFHGDPAFPPDRVEAFYGEWARQCVAGTMADTILVSEGARGLLGFLAWRRREPVSSVAGMPLFGGGLGGCRPDAPGAYGGLVQAATEWAHANGGVAECQTLSHNFGAIYVHEAVGSHCVRAEYTFHATLAEPGTIA